jgi:uncharacterized protein
VETRFTWDAKKAKQNERDHHISFETAKEVFSDPNQVVAENYLVGDEQRYQIIGMTKDLVLLLVVFVDRSNPEVEIFHIISARKAVQYEEDIYAAQIN